MSRHVGVKCLLSGVVFQAKREDLVHAKLDADNWYTPEEVALDKVSGPHADRWPTFAPTDDGTERYVPVVEAVSRTLVREVVRGAREVCGTSWPVVDQAHREARGGRPVWVVTIGLCNGVPDGARRFTTKRAAMAYLKARDA